MGPVQPVCGERVDRRLLTLVLYLTIFKRSFRAIGMARKRVQGDRRQEWFVWCFGSALFANVVAHFGINYMAHLSTYFFILLVCISVATFEVGQLRARPHAGLAQAGPGVGVLDPSTAEETETAMAMMGRNLTGGILQ